MRDHRKSCRATLSAKGFRDRRTYGCDRERLKCGEVCVGMFGIYGVSTYAEVSNVPRSLGAVYSSMNRYGQSIVSDFAAIRWYGALVSTFYIHAPVFYCISKLMQLVMFVAAVSNFSVFFGQYYCHRIPMGSLRIVADILRALVAQLPSHGAGGMSRL